MLPGNSVNPPVVTSLENTENPLKDLATLGYTHTQNGDTIAIAKELNGSIIELTQIGEAHSIQQGEVMGFHQWYLPAFRCFDHNYGVSAPMPGKMFQ